MDNQAVIFGRIDFSRGDVAKWKKTTVHFDRWKDWPDELGVALPDATVARTLQTMAKLPKTIGRALAGFEVVEKGDVVTVTGYLTEDGYLQWIGQACATFRTAELAGGEGTLGVVSLGGDWGYEIAIGGGRSKVRSLGRAAIDKLIEDPLAQKAAELYGASSPAKKPARAPAAKGADPGVHARVVAELERVGWDRALAALRALPGFLFFSGEEYVPTDQAFPTAEKLAKTLSPGASDYDRGIALFALSLVDKKAAEEPALRTLVASDGKDAEAAADVLKGSTRPEAVDALFGAVIKPPRNVRTNLRTAAERALDACPPAEIEARAPKALEQLVGDANALDPVRVILQLLARKGLALPDALRKALYDAHPKARAFLPKKTSPPKKRSR